MRDFVTRLFTSALDLQEALHSAGCRSRDVGRVRSRADAAAQVCDRHRHFLRRSVHIYRITKARAGVDSAASRNITSVALASYGEIAFDWQGFVCQALGIAFEAARLVCIQKLLTGLKMGPVSPLENPSSCQGIANVSLLRSPARLPLLREPRRILSPKASRLTIYLRQFAPVCAGLNLMLIPFFEGSAPFGDALELVGVKILIGNATTALALNIAVVFLIGCASSLVLTLSGVIKDILLVLGSVVIMGSTVTFTQMVGYAIALAGLVVFKLPKETTDKLLIQVRGALGR